MVCLANTVIRCRYKRRSWLRLEKWELNYDKVFEMKIKSYFCNERKRKGVFPFLLSQKVIHLLATLSSIFNSLSLNVSIFALNGISIQPIPNSVTKSMEHKTCKMLLFSIISPKIKSISMCFVCYWTDERLPKEVCSRTECETGCVCVNLIECLFQCIAKS